MKTRLSCLALLACLPSLAHTVSVAPGGNIRFFYGGSGSVVVAPLPGETCVVTVRVSEIVISRPLLDIPAPGPAVTVTVNIQASRRPDGGSESAGVQLSWTASGVGDCTGSGGAAFTVTVDDRPPTVASAPAPATTPTDPISLATGEYFFEEAPDLKLNSPMPLVFRRYYASRLKVSDATPSPLGDNWSHSFLFYLTPPTAASPTATVVDNRGRTITFQQSGATFTPAASAFVGYQLVQTSSGYTLGDPVESLFYNFNSSGRLSSIQDRNGNTHSISYTGTANNISVIGDGLGRSLRFSYDSSNRIISVSDGTRTVTYSYTGTTLTTFTDARNNQFRYNYDRASGLTGLIVSRTMPRGNIPSVQTFDSQGRTISQSDGDGNVTRFTYATGSTVQTDPAGRTQRYTFAPNGSLTTAVDENGASKTYGYDATGRLTSIRDSLSYARQMTYDSLSGLPLTQTEPDGTVTTWEYTSQTQSGIVFRNLTKVTMPGGSIAMAYDASGNVTAFTDIAGKITRMQYNGRGQVVRLTNPAGGETTYTYNQDGTPSTIVDDSGNTTTLTYDALWRATAITGANGAARRYTFDNGDNILSETDERGKTARFTWDGNGNLATSTDGAGATTTFTYDPGDRLISVTDPLGGRTSRTFDTRARVSTQTDRSGNRSSFAWDPAGRLTTLTDPSGGAWRREYDSEGFATRFTDPLNSAANFTRDSLGRAVRATTPSGATTSSAFDSAGFLTTFTDPSGAATTFTADPRGAVASATQGGMTNTFTRNDLGLITARTDGNGQVWRSETDRRGRITSLTDPVGGASTVTWDNMNRVSEITLPGEMGKYTVTRDPAGNITREAWSDGAEKTYSYDDAGRVTAASGITLTYDNRGDILTSNGVANTWDTGRRLSSVTVAPGKTVNYTYDNRNLLTRVTDWAGGTTTFTYDAAGQVLSVARPNGVTSAQTRNADGFVTSMTETGRGGRISALTLTRDGRGKVTAATRTTPAETVPADGVAEFGYDAASRVSGPEYDAMGRMTRDVARTFRWDLASRLTGLTDTTGATTHTYDAFDRRTSTTRAGVTRTFVRNYATGMDSIAAVREGSADLRYYVVTPAGRILYSVEATGNARRFYHYDDAGNTLFLTDDAGAVTDTYAYTPFGVQLSRTGNTDNPFTFAGQIGTMREGDTGLYYMRGRYYDSATARFLSRDPAGASVLPADGSLYSYARGNPLLFSDPTGRDAQVNGDLTDPLAHTDFSVEVWDGTKLLGTLNASFGEGGYLARKAGQKTPDNSSGGVLALGQGTFSVTFTPGARVSGGSQSIVVRGTAAQDEQAAQSMLSAIDFTSLNLPAYVPGTPAAAYLKARLKENLDQNGNPRSFLGFKTLRGSGNWTSYGVLFPAQTCNTFTGTALNAFLGTSYPTGVTAASVGTILAYNSAGIPSWLVNAAKKVTGPFSPF